MRAGNWWHWLANAWTPGITPSSAEADQAQIAEVDRNAERRRKKLEGIERETRAIRRHLEAEAELMQRQWKGRR